MAHAGAIPAHRTNQENRMPDRPIKLPLKFDEAISAVLKVKPAPKDERKPPKKHKPKSK